MKEAVVCLLVVFAVLRSTGQSVFQVSVEQEDYKAEENGNVTMTWRYPAQPRAPLRSVFIDVMYIDPLRTVFSFTEGKEDPESPDQLYRGRAWCDVRERGKVECWIRRLRHSDSGRYQCVVTVGSNEHFKTCDLSVQATSKQPTAESPEPPHQGRIRYAAVAGFGLVALVIGLLFALWLFPLTSARRL